MSLARRLFTRAPLVVFAVAYVALGAHPALGAVALAFTLLPAFVRAPDGVDAVLAGFAAVAGATIAALAPSSTNLLDAAAPKRLHDAVALAAVFAVAARVPFARSIGGPALTLAFALMGVTGLGAARPEAAYLGVVVVFIATALGALAAADPHRPSPLATTGRHRGLALFAVLAAVASTVALAAVLPGAHDRAQAYAVQQFGGGDERRAGFGDAIALGELRAILDSDAVALRVYGDAVDHLRGAVYTRYAAGRWYAPLGARGTTETIQSAPAETTIEHVGAPDRVWFVPLDAEIVDVEGGRIEVDAVGVVAPPEALRADRVGLRASAPRSLAAPDEDDLAVPGDLRAPLERVLGAWTSSAAAPDQRLADLSTHLADFTYALELPERAPGLDPIVAFLTDHRTGHCEYFASAFALLARTAKVPARVVAGYLVVERNDLAGHWVVRDRNAHAWVEAYVDGAWTTYDPTPAGELERFMPKRSAGADAYAELFAAWVDRAGRFVLANLAWLAPSLVVLAILFLFRRELWALRGAKAPTAPALRLAYSPPHEAYVAFEARLRAAGLARADDETLERFARRLTEEAREGDAALVLRYAAARYGGRDDPALAADLGGA